MKVLQILGDTYFGGASDQVLSLSKYLMENGFSVSLLSTNKQTTKKFSNEGIPVVSSAIIKTIVSPYHDLIGLIKLTKYFKKNKYDIVHTHTSKPGFIGRLAAHLAGVPIIIHTAHGYAFDDGYRFPTRSIFKYLEKKASKWSDLIIAISKAIKRITIDQKICTVSKIALIENGVDWQKFQSAAKSRDKIRRELGIGKRHLLVGMISRLSSPKLPEDFVRAAHNLKQQQIDAKYLIVGNGPLESKIAELIKKLKLESEFISLGFREDIAEILAAIDVFVLPTLWEGMSISLLEAMAAGKAIVTTDIPENREILKNGEEAIMVPVRDIEALAKAIFELANNKELINNIGRRGQEKAIKHYDLNDSLEKTLVAYRRLIKKTGLKD